MKHHKQDVFAAIRFTAQHHTGHVRKGTCIPYITHLLNVMKVLIEAGGTDCEIISGVLHDVVEDTSVSIDQIFDQFGMEVGEIVKGTTEKEKLSPETDSETSWQIRKENALYKLKFEASPSVLRVSLADKLDNIRAVCCDHKKVGGEVWLRFNAPKEKQEWFYRSLAEIFDQKKEMMGVQFIPLVESFRIMVNDLFIHPEGIPGDFVKPHQHKNTC